MPKSQRKTHFEEITPALGERVLNKSELKENKMKSKKNIMLLFFLEFDLFIFFFTFSSFDLGL